MSRLDSVKRLVVAALATGGIAAAASSSACRAGQPGEAPPLAPRPDPVQPSPNPVPGAPDPIDPIDPSTPGPSIPTEDGGIPGSGTPPTMGPGASIAPSLDRTQLAQVAQAPAQAPADAGLGDTGADASRAPDAPTPVPTLPIVSDAGPEDALLPPTIPIDDALPPDVPRLAP